MPGIWPGCCTLGEIVAVTIPERGAGGGPGSGAGPRGRARGSDVGAASACRNCCCATGSSTTAGRRGPASTNCGCGTHTGSTTPGCSWPTTPPTTRCWPPWTAGTGSTTAITAMAADSAFTPVVTRLGCLRGVSTLTAFGLAVEIGDWHRLTGRSIGAYLGLVPTEYSSGATRVPGRDHQDRQQPRPPAAGRGGLASPDPGTGRGGSCGGAGRRHPRRPGPADRPRTGACTPAGSVSMQRKKRPVVANAAIARELAGWCWSLAVLDD